MGVFNEMSIVLILSPMYLSLIHIYTDDDELSAVFFKDSADAAAEMCIRDRYPVSSLNTWAI